MIDAFIPPPLTPSQPPDFYRLRERPRGFERLAADLLRREQGVSNVDLFGIPGQDQYGVDVTGDLTPAGRVVVSCKCHEKATIAKLKAWSTEFLKYRADRWPDVRRFILVTSAENITATDILDQRRVEATRFAEVDIAYEVWGPDQLTDRIGLSDRSLAARHLSEAWADLFFGRPSSGDLSAAQVSQVQRLQDLVSDQVEVSLDSIRDRLRRGDHAHASAALAPYRETAMWDQLRPKTQASVLRLVANLAIAEERLEDAAELADQAQSLAPEEPRLRAIVASYRDGPEAALSILGAPTTRSGRQLRVVLHLEAERIDDAATAVEALVKEEPDDPETQRLLAHVRLLQNRREEGLEAARRAEAAAPHWIGVVRVGGIARYAQAVSPVIDARFVAQPNPVEPILMRDDEASTTALREALERFEHLCSLPHAPRLDRIWRLACLANLPDRLPDAAAEAGRMIEASPRDTAAATWALSRNLEVDLRPTHAALEEAYATGEADEYDVRTLVYLELRNSPQAARDALRAHLDAQAGDARTEAEEWIERLSASVEGDGPPSDPFLRARETGDWSDVADALREALSASPPSPAGLFLAVAAGQENRLDLLADHIEALAVFDTDAAVNVCFHALVRNGDPEGALAFLERYRHRFARWASVPEIRRLEVRAAFHARRLPLAIRLAEKLAADTGTLEDRLELAELHLASGHVQAALPTVRVALGSNQLDARRALKLSIAVTREDRALSQALWRRAEGVGIPDGLLTHALSQAHRIGLDDEAGALMPRLHARALANKGDVWTVDIDDVVEQIKTFQKRDRDISELYELGVIPIHMAAATLNLKLASFYWLEGRASARGPLQPLLIRHAGRPADLVPDVPWSRWRLSLDVTGLLLADQLDLLPFFAELNAPAAVSMALPDALYQLEQEVTHQQVLRIEAARAIAKAHLSRRLAIQTNPAGEEVTVRHERRRSEAGEPGPTVDTVASALVALGELVALYPKAAPNDDVSRPPASGGRLVFSDNTLETLAMRGGLDAALKRFACEVPQDVIDELSSEIVRADAGETLADRLRELRQYVATQLESEDGHFSYAPSREVHSPAADEEAEDDADEDAEVPTFRSRNGVEQSLVDIISVPGGPEGMVWCDDRHVTSYVNAQNNRVVGVIEVLNALVAEGHLNEEQRRQKLLQLRAGGAAFLPPRCEELTTPLFAAPVDASQGVVETCELSILRRNLGASGALDPRLKIGQPGHPTLVERPEEHLFLVATRNAVQDALAQVWEDAAASDDECRVRADWLWANVRLDRSVRDLGERALTLPALLVAALYLSATHLKPGKSKARDAKRRRAFADWISRTALEPTTGDHREAFLAHVAEHIETLLTVAVDDDDLPVEASELAAYLAQVRRRLYGLVPDDLQQALLARPTFADSAGLGRLTLLTVANLQFPVDTFWPACGRALRNGKARTRAYGGGVVTLRREDEGLVLGGAATGRVRHGLFDVLRAAEASRPEAIRAYLAPFDLRPAELAELTAAALAARGDATVAEALADAAHLSVAARYEQLGARVAAREAVPTTAFLPPPASQALHHLRLGNDGLQRGIARAWKALKAEVGPQEALLRLSGLPVDLAVAVSRDVRASRVAFEDLGPPLTPMMLLHLGAIAKAVGKREDLETCAAQMFDELDAEGTLFVRMLHWTETAYHADPEWRQLPAALQLALVWSHANRACALMAAANIEPRTVAKHFAERPSVRDLPAILSLPSELRRDCAAPGSIHPHTLAYHGMAYVFGASNVRSELPTFVETFDRFAYVNEEAKLPHLGLLSRDDQAPNAMGAFLATHPTGLLPDGLDLVASRLSHLEPAIAALETDPGDANAWAFLQVVGSPQLPRDVRDRLDALFEGAALATIARGAGQPDLCPVAVNARRVLGGPVEDGLLSAKIIDLAKHCAYRHAGPFTLEDGSPAADAFRELVECAAAAARQDDTKQAIQWLTELSLQIATAWPASAAALRQVLDGHVRALPYEPARILWAAVLELRRWA